MSESETMSLLKETFGKGLEIGMNISACKDESVHDDSQYVLTNLNNYVKFKVNDKGLKIYNNFWDEILKGNEYAKCPRLCTDEDGYSYLQLHEFMLIFGHHCEMGSLPFCENNDILVEKRR